MYEGQFGSKIVSIEEWRRKKQEMAESKVDQSEAVETVRRPKPKKKSAPVPRRTGVA